MGRLDELRDGRGRVEDLYAQLNKWSFESKLCPPLVHLMVPVMWGMKRGPVDKSSGVVSCSGVERPRQPCRCFAGLEFRFALGLLV